MSATLPVAADLVNGDPRASDPRWLALRSPAAIDIFHSVCHKEEVWRFDPYDVHDIHEQARAAFYQILEQAIRPGGIPFGRLLLLLGMAGSGKTHLLRAFRNHVHESRRGFVGYIPMTVKTNNYARYLLASVVESLDNPYWERESGLSGWLTLSNRVVDTANVLSGEDRQKLREAELDDNQLADLTCRLADRFIQDPRFSRLDPDLLRVMCYLQRREPRMNVRAYKYLRCEPLSSFDLRCLPDLVAKTEDHHPEEMITRLGQLIHAVDGGSLVLLIDQLEDMMAHDDNDAESARRFQRAMQTVTGIITSVPSSIGVIACLEDFYEVNKTQLLGPTRDRLEKDPLPQRLERKRSVTEIEKVILHRLLHLFESQDVKIDDNNALYPFTPQQIAAWGTFTTREVLNHCRAFCDGDSIIDVPSEVDFSREWNEFRTNRNDVVPDDEEMQAAILAWALEECSEELSLAYRIIVDREGRSMLVGMSSLHKKMLVAICNKRPQGGGLQAQVKELVGRAEGQYIPVIVRSGEYPKTPTSEVSKAIGKMISTGGKRCVCEDSTWRSMIAFREFSQKYAHNASFTAWRKQARPLASNKPLADILSFEGLVGVPNGNTPTPDPAPQPPTPIPDPPPSDRPVEPSHPNLLQVGTQSGVIGGPVELRLHELTAHAAFLGGSGSGKTTMALNLIEQLLIAGIPAILIDRKGDLCGYGAAEFLTTPPSDAQLQDQWRKLRERTDVNVFTPGEPRGRDLALPLIHNEFATQTETDREAVVRTTAMALGGMMGFKSSATDQKFHAILQQAISILAQIDAAKVSVKSLADLIGHEDPSLVSALGWIDSKLLRRLAEQLQVLELSKRSLLNSAGERLDIESMLGRNNSGKTQLTIICTKFLRDIPTTEFWVAQFLSALMRWGQRNPRPNLQAVIMLDEADIYLPAQRQPATKAPIEDLLRRGRSAGLGMFLATQSPGDFDYRCRDNIATWFLGKITQSTAQTKVKPILESRPELVEKLAGNKQGEFTLVANSHPTMLKGRASVLRTKQMSEDEIIQIAHRSASAVGKHAK